MKRQLYDMQFLYWKATGKHVTLIGRIVTKRRYKMEEYLVCEVAVAAHTVKIIRCKARRDGGIGGKTGAHRRGARREMPH